ncbi:hypothetical protein AGR4A_pAt10230 [Agrobacterium tumefaciens str. B6]|uniref:Uncharacterized protein n=1 Tax=Agrobacterium tumefaciens str. B6 TaxID=1183423 RepID=A0A822VCM7_AGRTU|nr:hypothetical protein AGR4A_pAt10230 [Agrobacterium tumefaciens str. B6]
MVRKGRFSWSSSGLTLENLGEQGDRFISTLDPLPKARSTIRASHGRRRSDLKMDA